jgi:DHA1 family inner membrane transport protein
VPASSSQAGAVVVLVVFGVASFVIGPPLINRVISAARGGSGLLVSAGNQAAFNAANALGAALGAQVLAVGYGLRATMVVGAALAGAGVLIALVAAVLERRSAGVGADDVLLVGADGVREPVGASVR